MVKIENFIILTHSVSLCTKFIYLFILQFFIRLIARYASKESGGKKKEKNEYCEKTKPCVKPNIETDTVIKEKKDICVYTPCPKDPCPIEVK